MTKLTYSRYLKLNQLLTSQQLLSPQEHPFAHDELLFIITHQSFELWFRQIVHEFDCLQHAFRQNQLGTILDTLKRILIIFNLCNHQFQVLETMSPTAFATFRNQFGNASGFQSIQFREIEFMMGLKRSSLVGEIAPDEFGRPQLLKRYDSPTVWDAFLYYLHNRGYPVPEQQLERDVTQPIEPCIEIQATLFDVYHQDLIMRHICEQFLDLDTLVQTWRQRHLLLAERMLGNSPGTYGMSLSYLRGTIQPHFPDLWKVRQQFIQTEPATAV